MFVDDIEYVMLRHPDLDAVRGFMMDFGLIDLCRDGDSLYLRSHGDAPFSYLATRGPAAFIGMGFRAGSAAALDALAARFDTAATATPTLTCAFGRDTLLQWGPAFPGL